MSLRLFHLLFVLCAVVVADMFGAWAIWHYPITHDVTSLALGIFALLAGLALCVYAYLFVRKTERADIG